MLTADGWFDWAARDPGPPEKVNGGRNTLRGVVPHSAEGYWPQLRVELWKPERRASWAASNLADGRFVQHYPVYAQTWTSGARYPNDNFFAFENEGVAGVALTDLQVANIVRVVAELSELGGWTPERPTSAADLGATLYEHRECVRWGADPTACPSGRIPWERILEEVMGPTKEEFGALFRLVLEMRQAFGAAIFDLAKQVYGDGDPRTLDLKQRVDRLEEDGK